MHLLLADDHELVRDALACLIMRAAPGYHVTGVATLDAAIEQLLTEDTEYDVILLDVKMPGMRGLNGLRRMIDIAPETPVALISGVASHREIRAGIDQGAAGYIPKTLASEQLIAALRAIASGEVFLPEDFHTTLHQSRRTMPDCLGGGATELTPREQDVLECLIDCQSNKEIGLALNLREITVKMHVRSLMRKFGARNRTEIVKMAMAGAQTPAA